jgi:hypothetical protein
LPKEVKGGMKELIVVSPDRIGLLADISETLGNQSINIESISVETSSDTAIIRLTTPDEKKAKKALESAGFSALTAEKLLVKLKDKAGELARVSRLLADENINIANVDVVAERKGEKLVAIHTDDNTKARKVLGIELMA